MSSMYIQLSHQCTEILLTVQNTHRRLLLFIDNKHFIGFLHKQNWTASTEINLLSLIHVLGLDETWSVGYNLGETHTCNKIFLLFCREILESVWQEEENFDVLTGNISKYI